MSFDNISDVLDMVCEYIFTRSPVNRVYQYKHAATGKTLFSVWVSGTSDDVYSAPMVTNPILIYDGDKWLGDYAYLNDTEDT